MNDRNLMLMYPHLTFEENRRELERERELRRQIRDAQLEARQRAKSSRASPLSRLRQALKPSGICFRPPHRTHNRTENTPASGP